MQKRKKRRIHQKRGRKGRHWNRAEIQPMIVSYEEISKKEEEDLLKFIFENKEKNVKILQLKKFANNFNLVLDDVLERLQKEKYIILKDSACSLTPMGEEIAGEIFKRHLEIEYFIESKTNSCDAHQMAHILEHSLTEDAIQGMFAVSSKKDHGKPLPQFNLPSGTIVDISWNSCNLIAKLISMGIFPGQKIHILNKSSANYLIEVKKSKLGIDRILAKGIKLIP